MTKSVLSGSRQQMKLANIGSHRSISLTFQTSWPDPSIKLVTPRSANSVFSNISRSAWHQMVPSMLTSAVQQLSQWLHWLSTTTLIFTILRSSTVHSAHTPPTIQAQPPCTLSLDSSLTTFLDLPCPAPDQQLTLQVLWRVTERTPEVPALPRGLRWVSQSRGDSSQCAPLLPRTT